MKAIKDARSFETAHFIPDYPAGFTARVTKKMWIEFKKGFGVRCVSNTSQKGNPNKWCAPKAGTYTELAGVVVIEASDVGDAKSSYTKEVWEKSDVGHAHFLSLRDGCSLKEIERFIALFGPFESDYERNTANKLLVSARLDIRVTEWEQEHKEPPYSYQPGPEKDAYDTWRRLRADARTKMQAEEWAKVLQPVVKPVAVPAKEPSLQMELF